MRHILFLCSYGGAKSVMAASYFNRIAAERNLHFVGVAAAAEEPYDAVPRPVADYLQQEGFDVRAFKPHRVTAEELESAAMVIAIDCDLAAGERWDDVPKVSDDLEGSAAAIRMHVAALAEDLRGVR
jgi:protein-tyrosine-phosphatase